MSPPSLAGQLRIGRGTRVAIIGRLSLITSERAKRTLLRLGAKPHSRSVAGTKLVVIGQGAAVLLRSGEWDDLMRRVREAQVACASELTALRALGLAPPAPLPNRSVPVTSIARPGVFDPPTLQTLQLFDLIDAVDDKVDFQTAVLVREIGRLLEAGVGMPEIVMTLAPSRRRALVGLAPHPTHGGRLVPDNEGGIAVRVGAWLSNLDGQLRLGVHSTGNATADEFVFDRGAGRASGGDL